MVSKALSEAKYDVVTAEDGQEAVAILEKGEGPWLVVLDWEMPALTGPEVCARVRELTLPISPYLILLTSRGETADAVAGLTSGADDYLTKPFHDVELQARVRVGERVVELQRKLADRVADLEGALARVNRLEGLLPICSYCKRVRDDDNYWHQVEAYVGDRSQARFSHGVCPECFDVHLKPHIEG
jgi:DNA-binding response OmpR family regulator